ncbi:hypothetical protein [Phenylobacterium sp.]|uniref:hypothetical protein n=1 Tax=Phenylobacterium sp. TaxID=1871053 RepID=UPI0035B0FB62
MIFHASIPADEPEHVARVIAEIWRGEAFPFPPWPGGFVAMAGDARNTTVEVYPRNQAIAPGEGQDMAHPSLDPAPGRQSCFHLAVATDRPADEIFAIGAREGWRTVRCNRGGIFDVIELWVENVLMIEVLTAEMQAQYLGGVTIDALRQRFGRRPPAAPAPVA